MSVATPPAPATTPAPPPVGETCPLCGAPLDPEQEWCLRCGAAARTRLAAPPNWKASVFVLAAVVALSLGVLAAALVTLAGGTTHSTAAPVTTTVTTAAPTASLPTAATTTPAAATPGATLPSTSTTGKTTAPGTTTPTLSKTSPHTASTAPSLKKPSAKAPSATTPSSAAPTSNPLVAPQPPKQ